MRFFFNDTATTEIYTLSLHDALPIFELHRLPQLLVERAERLVAKQHPRFDHDGAGQGDALLLAPGELRSEEHTSELQSHLNLVCRLLLEKKKLQQRLSLHSLTPLARD